MSFSTQMDLPRIPQGRRRTTAETDTWARTRTPCDHAAAAAARTHRRPTSSPASRPPKSRPVSILLRILPIFVLATLAPLTRAASPDTLTLDLPHVPTTCETLNLTWTGGTANYTLRVAQTHSSVPLETRTALADTSVLWTANACGGTALALTLTDAGGLESVVSFSVVRGSDGSCLSAAQRATSLCVLPATTTTTTTTAAAGAQGTAGTGTDSKAGGGPRVGVVVGVVVGIGVLVMVLATCSFLRARRQRGRRGAGVLGPGSRPYFVRHERDRARRRRRRETLLELEMPPPVYSDSADTNANAHEDRLAGRTRTSDSSPSPPLSVADHEQARPLMPVPETVQMAQLPRGRVEPEQLPTPFLSTYESSATTASSEGHAREPTGASHSGAAPAVASSDGEVPVGSAGSDEPPPPYTLTA